MTLGINDPQHNTNIKCNYAECHYVFIVIININC
jgi:hypothetical protein